VRRAVQLLRALRMVLRATWTLFIIMLVAEPLASSAVDNLRLLVHLTPCNSSDSMQQWVLSLDPASTIRSVGSGLCIANQTERPLEAVGLAASCGQKESMFRYLSAHAGYGQLRLVQAGKCLQAHNKKNVIGGHFLFGECVESPSDDYEDQLFAVNATSGQIASISEPGFCLNADPMALPKLPIHPEAIISHGFGDMNIAFHFAFSANLVGVCAHDSQPYHCAVQRFPADALVPQTVQSSVPYCSGCPENLTLLYDHCKNHPEWVDVGALTGYPNSISGTLIDSVANIYNASVYLSRAECAVYGVTSMINTWAMYGQMTEDPASQIQYRDMCGADSPVPYPYRTSPDPFVESECLRHTFQEGLKLSRILGRALQPPAAVGKRENSRVFRQNAFLDDFNVGFDTIGYYYVPSKCRPGAAEDASCLLLVNWSGCGGADPFDWNGTLARYAESNGIVLLAPRIKGQNNISLTHPNAYEVARGCWDSYGQTGPLYATQQGPHLSSGWRMVQQMIRV